VNLAFGPRIDDLSLSTRISLLVLLLIAGVTLLVAYILSQYERESQLTDRAARENFRLQLNANRLQQSVDALQRDVLFLSRTPPIQGVIRAVRNHGYDSADLSSLTTWKKRLEEIFVEFAKARASYYQIRYIGVAQNGKELVRVDVKDGKARVTPQNRLQAKASRGYYQATLHLKPGEVYLSQINLNREWGKVEVPHIRTIRGATPVFAPNGELFGMLVVNLDMGNMLDTIKTISLKDVHTYLVNTNGDFLIHPDPAHTFGFDQGQRYRWQDEFPGVNLADFTKNQTSEKLNTFEMPSGEYYVSARRINLDPRQPGRFLNLAYVMPASRIHEQIAAASNIAIASVFGVAVLITLVLAFIIRRTFQPLQKLTRIAHSIGDGHYDVELPKAEHGELGTLVWAFREMLLGIRKREEQALQLNSKLAISEKQANLIIDTAPEAIIVVDMQGLVTRANTRALQVFGYTVKEVVGQPVEMLIPERFRDMHLGHRHDFRTNPSQRMMGANRDLYALRKDGSEVAVEVGLSPMQLDNETYVIAALADISQRKHAEQALQQMNIELEQRVAERTRQLLASNSELEQFAYIASHDLQEPLRMVASYLQLVEKRYKAQLDATAGEFIAFAVDGANRMKQLIDGLLEYSRVQTRARDFEQVDMELILNNVLTDMQVRITERGAVITHDPLPLVIGDASQIQRLLQNLIGNAMKYCTSPTPRIHVAVEYLTQTRQTLPEDVPESGWLFSVTDNGIGIEEQYNERIFQLFQRLHTRNDYPGTGLGLALCKRIVERHGGRIWLHSQLGVGSSFYFILAQAIDEVSMQQTQISNNRSAGEFL
jgi:PAS domain S-box-containing protein